MKLMAIYRLIDQKFDKELELLKKRRKQNQSFNLFVIVNEILKQLKQNPIERRECERCSESSFHFIKVPCCERLMCIKCFLVRQFTDLRFPRCDLCKNDCNFFNFLILIRNFKKKYFSAAFLF